MIKVKAVKLGNAIKCGNSEDTWIEERKYDVWLLRNDWVKVQAKSTPYDVIYTSRDNVISCLPYDAEAFEAHLEGIQHTVETKPGKEPLVKAKP